MFSLGTCYWSGTMNYVLHILVTLCTYTCRWS